MPRNSSLIFFLAQTEANGKHIFLWFGREILHLHLGMFGSLYMRKASTPPRVHMNKIVIYKAVLLTLIILFLTGGSQFQAEVHVR